MSRYRVQGTITYTVEIDETVEARSKAAAIAEVAWGHGPDDAYTFDASVKAERVRKSRAKAADVAHDCVRCPLAGGEP